METEKIYYKIAKNTQEVLTGKTPTWFIYNEKRPFVAVTPIFFSSNEFYSWMIGRYRYEPYAKNIHGEYVFDNGRVVQIPESEIKKKTGKLEYILTAAARKFLAKSESKKETTKLPTLITSAMGDDVITIVKRK